MFIIIIIIIIIVIIVVKQSDPAGCRLLGRPPAYIYIYIHT